MSRKKKRGDRSISSTGAESKPAAGDKKTAEAEGPEHTPDSETGAHQDAMDQSSTAMDSGTAALEPAGTVEENHARKEPTQAEVIAQLAEESSELKDQLLRKQADFENFRKRLLREKEDAGKYANQMLLLDLVDVIDDFERAINSSEESKDFDAFHGGIVIIEKQLTSMLEKKWGLMRFNSLGDAFDPDRHQAIAAEEKDDAEHSVVLEDYQKGYLLYDRVLRPAKVKISQAKLPTDTDSDQSDLEE